MKISRHQFLKYFSLGAASTLFAEKLSWTTPKLSLAREEVKKMKIKKIEIYTLIYL
jgi:hypothetical protein